jgi:predicted secreted protein
LDDGRSSVPSGASLFLSLQECCDTHYGWNFNECMGIVIRSSGKYFPNWNASPNICLLDDGSHTLPAGAPLFADLATCCSSHYSWNLNECNGVVLGPTDKYFPNWEGTDPVCHLDDGSNIVPGYAPLYNDLATCCARHYSWNSNECNGVVAVPTNKYFPNWEGVPHVCLLDDGSNSLPVGAPLFADLATCCATHYSWNSNECNGVNAPSNKYFPNWGGAPHVCLLDDGSISLPSGALKYDTLSLCCATHYSWNSNECNGSLAPPSGMFFPDWEGTNDGCLKDDGSNDVPSYIQSNPSTFMHSSGQECCQIRYSWRYNACLANLR